MIYTRTWRLTRLPLRFGVSTDGNIIRMFQSEIVPAHFRQYSDDLNKLTLVNMIKEQPQTEWSNPTEHAVWSREEVDGVKITHKPTSGLIDNIALGTVKLLRFTFDLFAGFKFGTINEDKYLNRIIFLETVAAIPGFVGGLVRHLNSVRTMRRDHGWIHTLLEEAENERMHLLTFIRMKRPSMAFRLSVIVTQGLVFNLLLLTYMISPRSVHRFVGYIEEEAVMTYTKILEGIDDGKFPLFNTIVVPKLAIRYWRLDKLHKTEGEAPNFRDLISAIRADEANHRLVNHTFADMHRDGLDEATNPFIDYHLRANKTQSGD